MLALPFAMVKRSELPTPRKGQAEYDLFEEITGKDWHEMEWDARGKRWIQTFRLILNHTGRDKKKVPKNDFFKNR